MSLSIIGLLSPNTQIQEGLWLLLKNGKMTRADFFNEAHILNAPEVVRLLRKKGVEIKCEEIDHTNKFNRKMSYGKYILENVDKAREIYVKMNEK